MSDIFANVKQKIAYHRGLKWRMRMKVNWQKDGPMRVLACMRHSKLNRFQWVPMSLNWGIKALERLVYLEEENSRLRAQAAAYSQLQQPAQGATISLQPASVANGEIRHGSPINSELIAPWEDDPEETVTS